jgi:hypothetical protein
MMPDAKCLGPNTIRPPCVITLAAGEESGANLSVRNARVAVLRASD